MTTKITPNDEDAVFVIQTGNSISSIGFGVVFSQTAELLRRLRKAGIPLPGHCADEAHPAEVGTLAQYEQYAALLNCYAAINDPETWFDGATPDAVRDALERYRQSGELVRLYFGERLTGRDWLFTDDTVGRIIQGGGPMRVPLLAGSEDEYGSVVLSNCIVRIQNLTTGEDVYRHPNYHLPELRLVAVTDRMDRNQGYTQEMLVQATDSSWNPAAQFKSATDASNWLAFISGQALQRIMPDI